MIHQVKLFKGVESELEELEKQINDWLSTSGGKLISVVGNISPQTQHANSLESFPVSDILVIVTYEKPND